MTGDGRFPPHALQHRGVLPQGPFNGKNRPSPDIRRNVCLETEPHESCPFA